MSRKNGMGSHENLKTSKDEWLTPPELVCSLGMFDLDPCSPIVKPWKTANQHLSVEDNGLSKEWNGRVWCNPPYGRETGKWLAKCAEHKNAIALIFARTETKDWFEHVWSKAHSILFIKGRLTFYHVDGTKGKANAGAPSALISYNAENTLALINSGIDGKLIILSH